MRVEDLIAALQDMIDDETLSPDAEVRLAIQPNWPFEHSVAAVAVPEPRCDTCGAHAGWKHEEGCDEGVGLVDLVNSAEVVYLSEGGQIGYLSGEAREAVGW
ncbi:hypothetical protein ACFQH9_02030 [Pseudonocardia lutea]|uniref:Uncharacterized protein n=1 Tax=Pseudonocardia lutea TaxID=2172015 RepID=A0ABW1I1S4_9PSEU